MWTSLIVMCALPAGTLAAPRDEVIDSFQYTSDAEAAGQWKPMAPTQPVSILTSPLAGRKGLKLPCDLTGDAARAAWDRSVDLDLSRADRFAFWFYVDDPEKVSGTFSIYFQSGEGWYGATFTAGKGWNRIVVDKSRFGPEGKTEGWSKIKTIRLSVWKSVDAVTFAAIDDLQAVASEFVVVLGDRTPTGSPEWGTVQSAAKLVGKVLRDVGLDAGVLTDTDVESGALSGRALAVFPHNPDMTDKELDAVDAFIAAGGKVVAFYAAPPRLLQALGLEFKEYRKQSFEGELSSIAFPPNDIEGLPREVKQASWNIDVVKPVAKNARIIGEWHNAQGKATGLPALAISDTGAYMSHILLADDLPDKQRMMLALVGRFVPGVWPNAAARAVVNAQTVGEFTGLDQILTYVDGSKRSDAGSLATRGADLLTAAKKAEDAKSYAKAVEQAHQAHALLASAYCAASPAKPGEMRAVWCHSAAGVPGMSWDTALKELADGGFNMVFPNMLWAGRAFYKSDFLPVDESVATQGDRIAQCVAAGKKYGVQVHVWKVNWNLGNAPASFLAQMRAQNRTQKDPQGGDIDWLCPSNPLNFALERDSLLEVVRNYDVDGIHFDYIRYPDERGCYCDGCRDRFEQQFGVKVADWPKQVIEGDLKAKYLAFRRSNITRLVKTVSEEARKIKPGIKISAAVFASWPQCRDSVGQDWVSWVRDGYLDYVCPMDYTDSARQLDQWVGAQLAATGHAKPLLPGIGVTLGDWTLTPDQVVRQIKAARGRGADGFTLFNLDRYVVDEVLKALRAGATAVK